MIRGEITRNTFTTRKSRERALLIAVDAREKTGGWSAEDSVAELARLADTAGASVVGKVIQRLPVASSTLYLGKGKLEEVKHLKESLNYDLVLVDDELTPRQQRNLEEALEVKIIDRAALILDIFAYRARTREGQLQVELAQHEYLLPRLTGQWSHLERLGGGIGTRGPGESQLETDRRLIRQRIHRLKEKIEAVRRHRQLYREKRKRTGIPIVAIVGYTNAGKSTLLNALSDANVFVEDKLFATLDPTTRRVALPDNREVLISDTVGFIQKLPPTIVTAFRATLEELSEASILLHVVDATSPAAAGQCQTVDDILKELDISKKPRITALNKIDLLHGEWDESAVMKSLAPYCAVEGENIVPISAEKRWGLPNLLQSVSRLLDEMAERAKRQLKEESKRLKSV
ncbi:MAG: GTPase HflX [Chloroflexi bacterium]|nr:GTPase HflX [Chloroflexota bacterium]